MKRLILLFLLLCTAPATRAENWVPVATVQHGEIQVDLDSVQVHEDGRIHYWARQILNEQGVNFFRILYHQPIGLIKVYDIADCSAQQLHTPYKIAYRDLESREPAILESMDNTTIGLISNRVRQIRPHTVRNPIPKQALILHKVFFRHTPPLQSPVEPLCVC